MSNQTRQAIHDAIQAHVADESEDGEETFVTHWVTVAGVLSDDPETIFFVASPDGQPSFISAGLLHEALHPPQEGE